MLRKYAAAFQVLEVELPDLGNRALRRAIASSLGVQPGFCRVGTKIAHRHAFDYAPRPGFLYVRSRAISSRINDNYDEFPAEEIKAAYRTFIGKPVFVNHRNEDHRRARGVIIDAALHEDTNPDGSPDTWAEVLMEIDAVKFPRLAKAILAGEIDRTSMGTDVAYSVCTFCGNKAATPLDYCQHIPKLKGKRIRRTTASGIQEDVLVAERCYGLKFFENSVLVEDPADPTAFFLGVDASGLQMAASKTVKTASLPLADLQHLERVITERMGHYNGSVSWLLQNVPDAPTERVVNIILDRDAQAVRKMTGMEGYIVDKDVWYPKLVAAVEDMLAEVRSGWGQTTGSKRAKLHTALGETKAPPKVDTLREAECPVCGEENAYDGQECAVCGFVKPPDLFDDPDTDVAQQVDLRQEQQDAKDDAEDATGEGDLVCDNCGTEFDDPDATETPAEAEAAGAPGPQMPPGDKLQNAPVPEEQTADAEAEANEPDTTQPQEGDTCPDCGKGTLVRTPKSITTDEPKPGAEEEMAQHGAPKGEPGEKPDQTPGDKKDPKAEDGTPPDGKPKDAEGEDDDEDDDDDDSPPWLKKKKSKPGKAPGFK